LLPEEPKKNTFFTWKLPVALLLLLGAVICWISMAELLQYLQLNKKTQYNKQFFMVYVIHGLYAIFLPICGVWKIIEYIYLRKEGWKSIDTHKPRPFTRKLAVALCINPLMIACGYTWYLSLPLTSVSANTGIYNSAPVFVYIFSVLLLKERLTLMKVASVLVCIGGVILMSIASHQQEKSSGKGSVLGYALVVGSTLLYGLYEVLYKKFALHEETTSAQSTFDTMLFLGLTGAATILMFWPIILILNATHWEIFDFPIWDVWVYLLSNGGLDCVFNIFLLLGIMLTSPLFISVGSLLTIPASIVADRIFHSFVLSPEALVGGGLIVLGFLGLNFAEYMSNRRKLKNGVHDRYF